MAKDETSATKTDATNTGNAAESKPEPKLLSPQEELERGLNFISMASRTKEISYVQRTMRALPYLRRNITLKALSNSLSSIRPKDSQYSQLKTLLEKHLESNSIQDEMEVEESDPLKSPEPIKNGLAFSEDVIITLKGITGPVTDLMLARIYYYCSLFYELNGKLADIRPTLLSLLTFSTIKHDYETQANVLNLLLRNYLHHKLYDQAQKLSNRSTFPEQASNAQLARYMYYVGFIKVLRLDYTEAHKYVEDSIRKVPADDHTAGFQQAAMKLLVVIELLLGQIPKRSIFRQKYLRSALEPYFNLTQTVRVGELSQFQKVVEKYKANFEQDNLYNLILRLHHNVIRAGIRSISQAYSAISFKDISIKLDLNSEEDAQYIVAKAIRDGVIDATINYEGNYIQTNENLDIYSTSQPQEMFDQRIQFCLKLYSDSVKAMRYPENENSEALASAAEAREHEAKLAKDIIEDEAVDDMDDLDSP
ncbi:26S proteasome non-ATPase regulatory subunit [Mycoemilia scoparia]|uniref:26S proteasome non-ATPase regulatory subunit n=1 Tax=Mycoemilia scoparia TaxID=417184 RepID=A0A9W8AAS6_9FUNG|nr:26S proteasome non-ATPase regulatory subunit [Mycoemilia scoparia]